MPESSRTHRHSSAMPAARAALSAADRQAYLAEALASASALSDSLAYLAQLHAGQATPQPELASTFGTLHRQARRVLDFLEDGLA